MLLGQFMISAQLVLFCAGASPAVKKMIASCVVGLGLGRLLTSLAVLLIKELQVFLNWDLPMEEAAI